MRFTDAAKDGPLGHEALLDGLWRAAREDRLAHALCFVGPEGVGKFLCAERLAQGLLCARGIGPPCGVCGPCKRNRIDAHPDVFVVDPTQAGLETIAIGYVTPRSDGPKATIEQFLSLRALEGGWRVVLVRESERLVEEAQNALLKTLEEPGDSTLLVLETSRPDRLLPTIHSRCVRVPFRGLEHALVLRALQGQGVEAQDAALLARIGDGAPGLSLSLHERGVLGMRAILARALEPGSDLLGLAAEVSDLEGHFPEKTPTAKARARARTFLDLAAFVVRDGLRIVAGVAPETLPHGDLAVHLGAIGEGTLVTSLERILAARQDVDMNLAPDAAVERALLAFEPLRSPLSPVMRR